MGKDINLEQLSQLPQEQCYRTADTYFMLAASGERPGWLKPEEKSKIQLVPGVDYVLGIGLVKKDREQKETGIIDIRHIFSVSLDDLKGLASILRREPEARCVVLHGENRITLTSQGEDTQGRGRFIRVDEYHGNMYNYVPGEADKVAIERFCKLNGV